MSRCVVYVGVQCLVPCSRPFPGVEDCVEHCQEAVS